MNNMHLPHTLPHTLHRNGYNNCSCNFHLSYVFYATECASVKPYCGSPVYYLHSAPTWLSSISSPRQQYSIATCYCRAFSWPSLTEFVNARFLRNRSPLLYFRLVPSRVRDSSQDESSFNKVTKGRYPEKKNCCSFGFCPNEGGGGAQICWHLFISAFLVNKRGLFLPKCQ